MSRAELDEIRPHLEPQELVLRDVLIPRGQRVRRVYFVTAGLVSLVSTMEDGSSIEMGMVGSEGMVGIPSALGRGMSMTADAITQMTGHALSMDLDEFLDRVRRPGRLRDSVDRYTHAVFTMVSQNAACNRLHHMEERACRWLLFAHDRAGADTFDMTHEFLSQMLGARRATVTEIAQDLQDRGGIEYHRGQITVLDRSRLEAASCECYEVIRAAFDGLYD